MNFPENLLYTSLKRAIKIQIFPDIFMTDWADIWHINCCGGKFDEKILQNHWNPDFPDPQFSDFFSLTPNFWLKSIHLKKNYLPPWSRYPDPDFFEHFLGQSYFFSTNSMLAKFQLNRSCRCGAVKNESYNP